ncbi:MAG TPA: secretin N-terminal domain-containing protein, partial [Blastocatellia bacterium]|nr:secretin N-terminal domain-containing protein [Blastocatellia bacterium]
MIYRTRQKARQALVIFSCLLLLVPAATYAGGNGKKHFKLGMQYEMNKQWDKAAEQYALAAAESPSDSEYTLHLQRALVNAAIMLEARGDMFAQEKDYQAAYQAYRQGYSFDPTNEQTFVKMKRMAEAQGITWPGAPGKTAEPGQSNSPGVETSFTGDASQQARAETAELKPEDLGFERDVAERYVEKRYPAQDIIYRPMSLMSAITQLAQSMRLNVIFDSITEQMLKRNSDYSVELRDTTPARALEMILDTNNLMYAPQDSRTIVIAQDNAQNRMRYERQAVRTFYVFNADITEVRTALTSTIGTKQVVPYKQLNALVVRDTPANLELADQIIKSLDKSKAEVLVDINLYEIDKNDLLTLGNQLATADSQGGPLFGLSNIGGLGARGALAATAPPAAR